MDGIQKAASVEESASAGRRALRAATLVVVAALAVLVGLAVGATVERPSPVWAQDDPPDVRGLPVSEATTRLTQWNRSVFFVYEPAPDIGLDVDASNVLVSRMDLVTSPAGISANRPVVRLVLGRRIPDLTGLTREQALAAIARRELVLVTVPEQAPADWVVRGQRPEAGTILEFTPANTVRVELADTAAAPPPEPEPWLGLSRPALVAVAGSSVAGLVVLALLGTLAVRRAARRRAPPALAGDVEVRGYAGQIVGPDLSESGTSLSVRLEPHYDPGTFTLLEEVPR